MSRKINSVEDQGYNVTITGRHLQVTESMKDYALEKISKMERFFPHIIDIIVTMDIQKLDHRVDVVFQFGHFRVKAQAMSDSMYKSIDKVLSKLQSQLRRYKSKIQNHHAKGLKAIDMNVNVYRRPDEVEEFNDKIDDENRRQLEESYKPHEILKRETRPLKVLTFDEVIMKMELSGDFFQIFRSEEDQKIKVIYKRKDGCYGIIEPE